MNKEDEQILEIMDQLASGYSAILPDRVSSMKLEQAIQDVCTKWPLDIRMMRRQIEGTEEYKLSLRLIL